MAIQNSFKDYPKCKQVFDLQLNVMGRYTLKFRANEVNRKVVKGVQLMDGQVGLMNGGFGSTDEKWKIQKKGMSL